MSNTEKSDYDFQYFNMIRRVARELFINGYRGNYSDFINLRTPNKYKSRVTRIYSSLKPHISWDKTEKKWMTTTQMRISKNPFYYLFKSRSMDNSGYALYFSLVDMLANGASLILEQIYKKIDYDVLPEEILPATRRDVETRIRQFMEVYSINEGETRLPGSDAFIRRLSDNQYRLALTKQEIRRLFPNNDIALALLRVMPGEGAISLDAIVEALMQDPNLHNFYALPGWTVKTRLHKTLKQYCGDGILAFDEEKKTYSLSTVRMCELLRDYPQLTNAIAFFSEYSPLGVVGSYIMDEHNIQNKAFVFKNHYMAQALDSIVLYDLCTAIQKRSVVRIYAEQYSDTLDETSLIIPIRIFSRTVDGRRYVYAYKIADKNKTADKNKYITARLDNIYSVEPLPEEEKAAVLDGIDQSAVISKGLERLPNIWSSGIGKDTREVRVKFCNDDRIMYLSKAMRNHSVVRIKQSSNALEPVSLVIPIRFFSNTANNQQYVYAYIISGKYSGKYINVRMDRIRSVEPLSTEEETDALDGIDQSAVSEKGLEELKKKCSSDAGMNLCEDSMKFYREVKVMQSLITRESRIGTAKMLEDSKEIEFSVNVYWAKDMVPWLLGYTGKIVSLQVQKGDKEFKERLIEHIEDLHRLYNPDTGAGRYTQKSTAYIPAPEKYLENISPRSDRSELFQPHHSKYISCIKGILEQVRVPRTEEEINTIISEQKKRFGIGGRDREITFDKLLDNCEETGGNGLIKPYSEYLTKSGNSWWNMNVDERFIANLFGSQDSPIELPLDHLECRWLAGILEEPLIHLFLTDCQIENLKDVLHDHAPLYQPEDFIYIDQYKDGDRFEESFYQNIFRKIEDAIEKDIPELEMAYQTEKEKAKGEPGFTYYVKPIKIEYSLQNNTMILVGTFTKDPPEGAPLTTYGKSDCFYARLSNINNILPVDDSQARWATRYEEDLCTKSIVLRLYDIFEAFDRFHTMFSPYRKQTELTEPIVQYSKKGEERAIRTCEVELWYSQRDKEEILQKLRSLGKTVEILEPPAIRQTFKNRVNKQYELFVRAGLIKPGK